MENGYDADSSSVRVAVRIRPLIGREKVERCDECVSVVEEEMQIVMGKNRSFTYDYVFGKYVQQSDIWKCVDPLMRANFDGYNSTIFAYGQTGSGKTHTMGSGSAVHIPPEEYGIIPRVIMHMFETIESKTVENPLYKAELRIRFLEIYGEEIRDLLVTLGDSSGESKVALRETEGGEVLVTGAAEEVVGDADECLRLLERGTLCRTTGSTLMNAHSSRSHAIFTVSMVQHIPIAGTVGDAMAEGEYETRSCYFNFVDLAGSERQKRTQAEGKRLKEGIDINKGLLALGNVISALGDDKKRGKVHVPYRDSKLTRMLQDSLGGNSRTLMLTCVSPADVNFEETLNALKYANRARNIQNKAVVNRDEASTMTLELRRQVQMLQAEVHRLRNPGLSDSELKFATVGTNLIGMQMDFDSYSNLRSRAENAENEVARLTSELKRGKTQLDHLKEEMIAAQAERDYLRLCLDENNDGASLTPEEREAKSNILKDNLRTIYDLQEKLRMVERERDRAVMTFNESDLVGGRDVSASTSALASFGVPSFVESGLKEGSELIEKAEKEIERESARLKKLKAEESGDDSGAVSEGESGTGDVDVEETLEATEEEADRQRVFQRRQQHLGESVQDLAHDISLKEQLVQNIRQAQENYEKMKNFYEQKMTQMAEEVRMAQLDRDKLIEEIQQIEAKIQQGDHSGGSARLDKLSKDLKVKEEELSTLRKKQNEINRFMNQKKKNEMQLRVLTAEISNMKRQKVDLVKKMQDERKRYEDEAKTRQKEILSLKRIQARDKQQIQRLGTQKDAQERVLKRKMEEITAAKLKLKHQQQLQAQAKRMNSSYGRNKNAPPQSKAEKDANWLSEEVKRRAEEQQKLEQLQREREAVAKEMEALYAQRDRLEADLRKSIAPESNIRDVLISPMKTLPLNRRLSGRLEQQLTPEEEQLIFDLEERIESCHAQLEYKEEKISEIAEDGQHTDSGAALVKIERTQSLPEARSLLKMLFGMAVDVKKQDQRKEKEIAKLHVEMTDMASLLEQERSRTQQIKQSYEESLHKVVQGGLESSSSPGRDASIDDRSRILLSVSEERNSVLRKKCDELESVARQADQAKQALQMKLMKEQHEQVEREERIAFLEAQLGKVASQGNDRSRYQSKGQPAHSVAAPTPAATPGRASGPISWVNEFDDDDEDDDMTGDDRGDEEDMEYDDDVDMKDGDDDARGSARGTRESKPHASLKDRREFRVELDDMEDNLDSISLSERRRLGQVTARRRGQEADEGGEDHASYKDDSPTQLNSDDSSSTTNSSSSIFVRLSNPSNFTGIHKNRVRESVTKREVLQTRSDRNRSRRLRDRGTGSVTRPPRSGTPTERTSGFGFKSASKKTSQVMEVLANIKRENESEQYVSSPSLRQPQSYGLERYRDGEHMESSVTQPPPAPQVDVYSRLAGQYTASAQSKRQASSVARRPKAAEEDGRSPSEKQSMRRISSEDDIVSALASPYADGDYQLGSEVDSHADDNDGHHSESNYDPLLGGGSLVAQVHDDYRERLNNRTGSQSKIPSSSSGRF